VEDRKDLTQEDREARRSVLKKMAYAAPIVLSLAASASFARAGSGDNGGGGGY
jgi:hypothetical protein